MMKCTVCRCNGDVMQVNDDILGNNWNTHIYIDIDMTVIELRHNSYIGQKKEFWRCARRGMPQLVPTGAGLHNHPQLWKPWPSSMIGVSHWNSQFVDDLPIEYWCSTWCSSAALSERKKVGTIPEFNLIPRPVANCTSAVRRIAGNFVGSVKATTGSRCTSLGSTRQEICQICPISGLNRWRDAKRAELCMRISIEYYEPWYFFPMAMLKNQRVNVALSMCPPLLRHITGPRASSLVQAQGGVVEEPLATWIFIRSSRLPRTRSLSWCQ